MLIRPAIVEDIPRIMDIRLTVRENRATRESLAKLGITEESMVPMIEGSHSAYCAEIRQEVIGFGMAELESGEVHALFVLPGHEGLGAGSRLLAALIQDLWNAGHERLTLVTEPNSRAYSFYERQGWTFVGEAARGDVRLELRRPKT